MKLKLTILLIVIILKAVTGNVCSDYEFVNVKTKNTFLTGIIKYMKQEDSSNIDAETTDGFEEYTQSKLDMSKDGYIDVSLLTKEVLSKAFKQLIFSSNLVCHPTKEMRRCLLQCVTINYNRILFKEIKFEYKETRRGEERTEEKKRDKIRRGEERTEKKKKDEKRTGGKKRTEEKKKDEKRREEKSGPTCEKQMRDALDIKTCKIENTEYYYHIYSLLMQDNDTEVTIKFDTKTKKFILANGSFEVKYSDIIFDSDELKLTINGRLYTTKGEACITLFKKIQNILKPEECTIYDNTFNYYFLQKYIGNKFQLVDNKIIANEGKLDMSDLNNIKMVGDPLQRAFVMHVINNQKFFPIYDKYNVWLLFKENSVIYGAFVNFNSKDCFNRVTEMISYYIKYPDSNLLYYYKTSTMGYPGSTGNRNQLSIEIQQNNEVEIQDDLEGKFGVLRFEAKKMSVEEYDMNLKLIINIIEITSIWQEADKEDESRGWLNLRGIDQNNNPVNKKYQYLLNGGSEIVNKIITFQSVYDKIIKTKEESETLKMANNSCREQTKRFFYHDGPLMQGEQGSLIFKPAESIIEDHKHGIVVNKISPVYNMRIVNFEYDTWLSIQGIVNEGNATESINYLISNDKSCREEFDKVIKEFHLSKQEHYPDNGVSLLDDQFESEVSEQKAKKKNEKMERLSSSKLKDKKEKKVPTSKTSWFFSLDKEDRIK
jgi:hypothetical protein